MSPRSRLPVGVRMALEIPAHLPRKQQKIWPDLAWQGKVTMPTADENTASLPRAAEAALVDAYAAHAAGIHTLAYHLLGTNEDADDITQETFIRACGHLEGLRDVARLKGWLYRIATNLCMDVLRRRTRARAIFGVAVPLDAPEGEWQPGIPEPRSAAAIDGVAERDEIASVMAQLGEQARVCLLLHSVQGFSYREIADVLGISPGAAAVRLSRARSQFAALYERARRKIQ